MLALALVAYWHWHCNWHWQHFLTKLSKILSKSTLLYKNLHNTNCCGTSYENWYFQVDKPLRPRPYLLVNISVYQHPSRKIVMLLPRSFAQIVTVVATFVSCLGDLTKAVPVVVCPSTVTRIRTPTAKKEIFLTFDDGPDLGTDNVLQGKCWFWPGWRRWMNWPVLHVISSNTNVHYNV